MKYLLVAVLLTGCSTTVPVRLPFPELPETLLQSCPTLQQLKDGAQLSDVAKTVTVNYTTYYDCAVKHDALTEWYKIQKKIYEESK